MPHHHLMRACCHRYALVNPVSSTSHLQVAQEGLQLLESIDSPVAPVVVIGPYRSGKSFLLNQLLGVTCSRYPGAVIQAWHQLHVHLQAAAASSMPATV